MKNGIVVYSVYGSWSISLTRNCIKIVASSEPRTPSALQSAFALALSLSCTAPAAALFRTTESVMSTRPSRLVSPSRTSPGVTEPLVTLLVAVVSVSVVLLSVVSLVSVVEVVVAVTVTVTSTVSPSLETLMVVSPAETPVTVPFSSTLAIESSAVSNVQPSLFGFRVSVSPTPT